MTGTCWFCKGEFVMDALIAGYDTFDEQRLACLACNERMTGNWPTPEALDATVDLLTRTAESQYLWNSLEQGTTIAGAVVADLIRSVALTAKLRERSA